MKGLGFVSDPADERDLVWRAAFAAPIAYPAKHIIGVRGPVLDQGEANECVTFSSASMHMNLQWREHRKFYAYAPHELYERCKEIDNYAGDGTYIRAAMKVMLNRGILAYARPGKLATDTLFKIKSYFRLTTREEICEAVYGSGPVVLGIVVDKGIYQPVPVPGRTVMAIPAPDPSRVEGLGHAMCVVGYDASYGLLMKNSWSRQWGTWGLAWLPWAHLDTYPWDAWRAVDLPDGVLATLRTG